MGSLDISDGYDGFGSIIGKKSHASYDKAIQYHWQGDTSTVSIAGQVVSGGNLVVNIRD